MLGMVITLISIQFILCRSCTRFLLTHCCTNESKSNFAWMFKSFLSALSLVNPGSCLCFQQQQGLSLCRPPHGSTPNKVSTEIKHLAELFLLPEVFLNQLQQVQDQFDHWRVSQGERLKEKRLKDCGDLSFQDDFHACLGCMGQGELGFQLSPGCFLLGERTSFVVREQREELSDGN